MTSRRKFIRNVSLGAASGALIPSLIKAKEIIPGFSSGEPVIVSTWEHGLDANKKAMQVLQQGARPVDAAQQGVMVVESDNKNTSVGLAGYPDRDGRVTLDACLMDEFGNAGSVSFLEGIEHPIAVARLVMDKTPHVMLSGDGALQFALTNGFKVKKGLSSHAKKKYEEWLKTSEYKPIINIENHDTIGLILCDANGGLSGACTTSGLAFKMHGRVGDSPIIGAGLFVDPEVGAATATGYGEAVIKICGSHTIVEAMRNGSSPQQACEQAINRIVKRNKNYQQLQVGFLAINKNGEIGAYSVQSGFQYAVAKNGSNVLMDAPSLI